MVSVVHLFYSKPFFSTRGGVESGADYMVGGGGVGVTSGNFWWGTGL